MRTFKRLEIECLGTDTFGLGQTNRTIIRRLEETKHDIKEAGSSATTDVFDWLRDNYFGYELLRKMMVNDYIDTLKDKNLAELLNRVLKDVR